MRWFVVAILLSLNVVGPALASEGVLEINQVCAVQTGCFSGDSAGLPVTIDGSAGRSYHLTSEISVPNENTTAILVVAPDVSIDLAGFSIRGPNSCTEPPTTCRLTGTGHGVHGQEVDRLSVSNGSIVGMGGLGIYSGLGDGYAIRNVRLAHNRFEGIRIVGSAARAEGVTSLRNGKYGIQLGDGSTVSGSNTFQNGEDGIVTGSGATVAGNTTSKNGSNGISTASGATIEGNTAYRNGGYGIDGFQGTTVIGNTVSQNGGYGIHVWDGSSVQKNTIRANGSAGLWIADGTYRENTITDNVSDAVLSGYVLSPSINLGNNFCRGPGVGSAACP